MNTAEKYVEIVDAGASPTGKTRRYSVRLTNDIAVSGRIMWYGGFRKYVFYPTDGVFFDHHCLRMIADFCEKATKTRGELKSEALQRDMSDDRK